MKSPMATVFTISSAVGLAMLVGGLVWAGLTFAFVSNAESATGVIVDFITTYDEDGESHYPVVPFTTNQLMRVEFKSSVGSGSVPRIDSAVEILYDGANPEDARINSFTTIWLFPLIVTGLGVVFGAVGFGGFFRQWQRKRLKAWLLERGRPIETELKIVEINRSVRVNYRSPFQIISEWRDPSTDQVHVFKSGNLWLDSEPEIPGENITVYIDPDDPERNHMDVSFLTELVSK